MESANLPVPEKKKSKERVTSSAKKPVRPTYSKMVFDAVSNLKDRKGSSRQAIAKYLTSTYNVEGPQVNRSLSSALRKMVTNKELVQSAGTGASGRFRIDRQAAKAKEAKSRQAAKGKKRARPAARKAPVRKRAKTARRKSAGRRGSPKKRKTIKRKKTVKRRKSPKKATKGKKRKR